MSIFKAKRPSRRENILGIVVMTCLISVVLNSWMLNISEKSVDAKLKRFAEYVAKEAADSGKEAIFTYGTVEIGGWGAEKYVTVSDVKLEVRKPSEVAGSSIALSSPKMRVSRDIMASGRTDFLLFEPLTISRDGNPEVTVSFSSPIRYGLSDQLGNQERELEQMVFLPTQITVNALSKPEKGGSPESVVITAELPPSISFKTHADTRDRQVEYFFKQLKVVASTGATFSTAAVTGSLSEKAGLDNRLAGEYKFVMSDFVTNPVAEPCSFATEMSYAGDRPLLRISGMAVGTRETEVNIKTANLTCDKFQISANGHIVRLPDDPLVSGDVSLGIDNPNELLASSLFDEDTSAVIGQALAKISGQPLEGVTRLDIPLKREKNSTFMVGGVTFEELATSMLAGALNLQKLAPASTSMEAAPQGDVLEATPEVVPEAPLEAIPAPEQPAE